VSIVVASIAFRCSYAEKAMIMAGWLPCCGNDFNPHRFSHQPPWAALPRDPEWTPLEGWAFTNMVIFWRPAGHLSSPEL